jgi:hypothetical protein
LQKAGVKWRKAAQSMSLKTIEIVAPMYSCLRWLVEGEGTVNPSTSVSIGIF